MFIYLLPKIFLKYLFLKHQSQINLVSILSHSNRADSSLSWFVNSSILALHSAFFIIFFYERLNFQYNVHKEPFLRSNPSLNFVSMSLTLKHTLPKFGTIRFDLDNCPQIQKQVFQVSRLQIAGILRHPAPLAP